MDRIPQHIDRWRVRQSGQHTSARDGAVATSKWCISFSSNRILIRISVGRIPLYPRACLARLAAVSALVLMSAGARADKTLYESMGGESVLRTAVDHFADNVQADDRINFTFAEADISKFKKLIFEQ